jgi:3-deoxy-D-manno-octulosonic-acid transferase
METELWPNLIHACRTYNVPVIIANARLSERSYRGYQRFSALTVPMLKAVTAIAAQHKPDGERFLKLGVKKQNLNVTGSIKFDIQHPVELKAQIERWKQTIQSRPTWIAASTHPGEEEIILSAHQQVLTHTPNALLILVPRHIERADKISELIQRQSLSFSRRTQTQHISLDKQVFLVDTLGELMLFYGLSDIAFIGNSLNQGGGHNPIEPASFAKPIITGDRYVNFKTIFDAMKHQQAVIVVDSEQALTERLLELLSSTSLCANYGQNAVDFYKQQQGALERLFQWIETLTLPNISKK